MVDVLACLHLGRAQLLQLFYVGLVERSRLCHLGFPPGRTSGEGCGPAGVEFKVGTGVSHAACLGSLGLFC